jgi:hypothetical protein
MPDESPAARIRAIREREQAATKGPWVNDRDECEVYLGNTIDEDEQRTLTIFVDGCVDVSGEAVDDLEFAAAARSDIPYLLGLFKRYGEHDDVCDYYFHGKCTCGLSDILKELEGATT